MMSKDSYIPKYFELYELLPPEMFTYQMMGQPKENQSGWKLFDERLLITIDVVREIIGEPLICNTWYQDGNRVASGLRSNKCLIGALKSPHKEGKAVDLLCPKYTAEQMRQMIVANQNRLPFSIRIESNVNWLHIDVKVEDYVNKKVIFF